MKLTIPTILTILRLVLLPLLVWLLFVGYYWWALGLYSFGAFTDFLDGWIARKYDQITPFGTFLDPISDKIYVCTLFIALVAAQHISGVWITAVIVILAREFMVSGLREYLGPKNVQLPVSKLAKWKTAVQMIATGVLIIAPLSGIATFIGLGGLVVATALTLVTGWAYLKTGMEHM